MASLRTALLSSVYPTDGTSLASMGLQTDRSGQLTLDTTKLAAAYAKDPGAVAAAFGTGSSAPPGSPSGSRPSPTAPATPTPAR